MELGRVSKNYYIPYRLPIRQAHGARMCIKKLLYPIPSTYPKGPWSYAVIELGRASKNYYIPSPLPIRQAHGAMYLMEL